MVCFQVWHLYTYAVLHILLSDHLSEFLILRGTSTTPILIDLWMLLRILFWFWPSWNRSSLVQFLTDDRTVLLFNCSSYLKQWNMLRIWKIKMFHCGLDWKNSAEYKMIKLESELNKKCNCVVLQPIAPIILLYPTKKKILLSYPLTLLLQTQKDLVLLKIEWCLSNNVNI